MHLPLYSELDKAIQHKDQVPKSQPKHQGQPMLPFQESQK